jgi:hypothetical protein
LQEKVSGLTTAMAAFAGTDAGVVAHVGALRDAGQLSGSVAVLTRELAQFAATQTPAQISAPDATVAKRQLLDTSTGILADRTR